MSPVALVFACASAPPPSPRDVADANDTGRAVAAQSDVERELLRRVPQLPADVSVGVGRVNVVAEPAYAAASGRTCRALRWQESASGKASRRLACTSGREWFFVPDVFGPGTASK